MIQFDDHIFQTGWNHQPVIYDQFWSPLSQESSIGRFFYDRDRTDLVPQVLWSIATPGILKETTPAPRFCWQDLPHITLLLLMEEILHQLICSFSHYLQGFIHPRWCRISSINSIMPPSSVSFGKKHPSLLVEKRKFLYHLFFQINGLPGHLSQETRIWT